MTDIRRPIHLQLRPTSAFGSSGGALSTPVGNNAPASIKSFVAPVAATATANATCHSPKALSPTTSDSLPTQIMPYLYVGNQEQTNRETLNRLNIKYVLSLGLLPIVSNANNSQQSPSSPTNNATNHSSTATTETRSHVILPPENTSVDFKIRIRSNTPTPTPTSPSLKGLAKSHDHFQTATQTTHRQQQQTPTTPTTSNAISTTAPPTRLTSPTATQTNSPHHNIQHKHNQYQHQQNKRVAKIPTSTSGIVHASGQNHHRSHPLFSPNRTSSHQYHNHHSYYHHNNRHGGGRDENKGVKSVRSIYCKCINVADNPDQLLIKFFDEAHAFINEARRKKCNILIHCLAGISRSPTFAIAHLMRVKSLHWQDAYDLVKQCRPQIDPNLSFMGQLRLYNKTIRDQQVNGGVSDNITDKECAKMSR